ncbi:MAG: hypothetical protein QME83_05995 [Thermodesulfobacteriota bacterium]|nr:hypothetical protein [Thermodesulfobacteriota bacterium]
MEENRNSVLEIQDNRPEVKELFSNLKKELPNLEKLFKKCSGQGGYEDPIYRFYHQSFKVYWLQDNTKEIVETLQALLPNLALNPKFLSIVNEGLGKKFKPEDNARWLEKTRPILEAFFHARYFLEMAVRYGNELEYPPNRLPSGWASFLYLYNLR